MCTKPIADGRDWIAYEVPGDDGDLYVFYVSPIDAWVGKYTWRVNRFGYVYRQSRQKRLDGTYRSANFYVQREIMGLDFGNPMQAHHRNGDRLDNRRNNLEVITKAENLARRGQIEGPEVIEWK